MTTAPIARVIAVPILLTALALAGCAGTRFGAGTSTSPAASASHAVTASGASSPDAASPTDGAGGPAGALGPFACDLPVERRGNAVLSHITDVRVGTHEGYDRVVIEFDGDVPEYVLSRAEAPYTSDPSGRPMEVAGDAVVHLALLGGTRFDENYQATYDGPRRFERGFPKLVQLVESGDFEATSGWYIGLTSTSCVRVLELDAPSRLVIDLEH